MVKYTLKCLKYGNYDNFIKQKKKEGIKHVKNIAQSWYLRLYQTNKMASEIQTWNKCNKNVGKKLLLSYVITVTVTMS